MTTVVVCLTRGCVARWGLAELRTGGLGPVGFLWTMGRGRDRCEASTSVLERSTGVSVRFEPKTDADADHRSL